jgi:hypothetical protein
VSTLRNTKEIIMVAIKPDTRTVASMAAGKGGEWGVKATPVKGKTARKRAAKTDTPKREARPYPTVPVNARPGSRIAASVLRTPGRKPGEVKAVPSGVRAREYVAPLPFGDRHAPRPLRGDMTKREQSNTVPFMPEFQAEGQPFPRMARDENGRVMPRVRTDNGMTDQLKGKGIGRREDGQTTYTKRQLAERQAESQAVLTTALEVSRLRQIEQDYQDARKDAKRALMDAMGRKREAIERGDVAAAEAAQEDIRRLRKASRFKG